VKERWRTTRPLKTRTGTVQNETGGTSADADRAASTPFKMSGALTDSIGASIDTNVIGAVHDIFAERPDANPIERRIESVLIAMSPRIKWKGLQKWPRPAGRVTRCFNQGLEPFPIVWPAPAVLSILRQGTAQHAQVGPGAVLLRIDVRWFRGTRRDQRHGAGRTHNFSPKAIWSHRQ
jgi:hypothetical protein